MPEPTASTIAVTSDDPKKKKQEDVENKDKVDDKKVKEEKAGEELVMSGWTQLLVLALMVFVHSRKRTFSSKTSSRCLLND